jgi:NMD protein affecting ribosome stability and mRNA decay
MKRHTHGDIECAGDKGYVRRGTRGRSLNTELGDVTFSLQQVQCKRCSRIFCNAYE